MTSTSKCAAKPAKDAATSPKERPEKLEELVRSLGSDE